MISGTRTRHGFSRVAPTSRSSSNGWGMAACGPPNATCTHCPMRTRPHWKPYPRSGTGHCFAPEVRHRDQPLRNKLPSARVSEGPMTRELEFGLLGPLLVRREAEEVPIAAARQRVVLAALLLRANQVVPVGELAGALWDEELPASARATVRNYVKRLRRALGDVDRLRIATRGDGYLIGVADGELDLARFETLRDQAGKHARAGQWAEASDALHEALALWRGQPLADVPSDVLARREGPRLAELRLQAAEDRFEADLQLGRHGEVIAGLQQLAEAEPLRERLHELLMLALYRAGRQADALAAYRRARATLVDELGIEPGPALRELHQQILAGDPALALSPPLAAAGGGGAPVPRQLPTAVADFTGRAGELAAL